MSDKCNGEKKCCCPCHHTIGLLITLIGLTLLLSTLNLISSQMANLVWPILIILIGLKKTFGGFCKCCKSKDQAAS